MVVNWSIQQSGRKQTNEVTFFNRMSSDVEVYKARYARKGREKSRGKSRKRRGEKIRLKLRENCKFG